MEVGKSILCVARILEVPRPGKNYFIFASLFNYLMMHIGYLFGARSATSLNFPVLHGNLHAEAAVEMLSLAEWAGICMYSRSVSLI